MTTQLTPSESGQIPTGVDEELGISNLVFGGETVEKRRRGISPASAEHFDIGY